MDAVVDHGIDSCDGWNMVVDAMKCWCGVSGYAETVFDGLETVRDGLQPIDDGFDSFDAYHPYTHAATAVRDHSAIGWVVDMVVWAT